MLTFINIDLAWDTQTKRFVWLMDCADNDQKYRSLISFRTPDEAEKYIRQEKFLATPHIEHS